jgi:hypothetical protein
MSKSTRFLQSVGFLALAGAWTAAPAAMLDFESSGLTDNQNVSAPNNPFAAYGIQFTGNNALFAEDAGGANLTADGDPEGFVTDRLSSPGNGVWDTKVAGETSDLGGFFLRGPGITEIYQAPGNPSWPVTTQPLFEIKYLASPTGQISGEIWDIDGVNNTSEQWIVRAYDANDVLLATQTSPEYSTNGAGTLDGAAWLFTFAANPNIDRLAFFFDGTKTAGIGVAFDNFETGVVPLPAAAWLLLSGLGALGVVGRRRPA